MVDDGYDSQEPVMYWKFTDIKEWYKLKAKIPAIHGGISYGDKKIICPQALSWWVMDLTLQGKIIDLNYFNTDIIADTIEESRRDFEDTRYGKGDLSNTKDFSYEN